jgi:hypothetical protein
MIRIELDPVQFYGLGWISQKKEVTSAVGDGESHWILFRLENSLWSSLLFKLPKSIDEMISEELTNILASRIATALSKSEETWVGISAPHFLNHRFRDPQTDPITKIEFEFRYAGTSIPVIASLHAREVAHA